MFVQHGRRTICQRHLPRSVARLKKLPGEYGVDVLCLGGTKKWRRRGGARDILQKRSFLFEFKLSPESKLASWHLRRDFLAAQWLGLLTKDVWLRKRAARQRQPPTDWPTVFVPPERSTSCFPLKQMAVFVRPIRTTRASICSRAAGIFYKFIEPDVLSSDVFHGRRLITEIDRLSADMFALDESHLYRKRNEVEQLGHRRNYDSAWWAVKTAPTTLAAHLPAPVRYVF